MAIYDCECGCGKEVEKIIVFSQACRMKLRRKSVKKHNGNVINPNGNVMNHNADDDESVNNHNADVMKDNNEEQRECVFCNRKYPVNEDGNVYCKKCKQTTIYNAVE